MIQDSISPFKNIPTTFSLLRISVSSVWSVPGALGTEQIQPHEGGEGAELSAGQHKELRSDKPPALREGDHYCQLFQLRSCTLHSRTAIYTHPSQPRLHCQAARVLVDTPEPVLILQEGCLCFFVFKASVQYSNAPPKSIFTHSTSTVVCFTSQKNKHGMHLCGQALSPDSPQGTVFFIPHLQQTPNPIFSSIFCWWMWLSPCNAAARGTQIPIQQHKLSSRNPYQKNKRVSSESCGNKDSFVEAPASEGRWL